MYVLNGRGKGGWENVSHICVYGERLIDYFLFSSDLYNNLSNHPPSINSSFSLYVFFIENKSIWYGTRSNDNKQHENYFS